MDTTSFRVEEVSSALVVEAICKRDSSLSFSIKTLFGLLLVSICSDPMAWRTRLPMRRLAFKGP